MSLSHPMLDPNISIQFSLSFQTQLRLDTFFSGSLGERGEQQPTIALEPYEREILHPHQKP